MRGTLAPANGTSRFVAWCFTCPEGEEISAAGRRSASRAGRLAWALFEGARNPHVLLITIYIFAPYFALHLVGDGVRGQAIWSNVHTVAGIIIALTAPILGAIADAGGRRKPWLALFWLLLAAASAALWFAKPDDSGLPLALVIVLLVVSFVSFEYTAVFHNAMLPAIAPDRRVAALSGLGLALGNLSGVILFVFMLLAFALPGLVQWSFVAAQPWFGIDQAAHEHERLSGVLVAIWLVVFGLPLFLLTPDQTRTALNPVQAVRHGLRSLAHTLRSLRHYRNVALYLLARMIYNDGKTAILIFGGVYAAGVFHWQALHMIVYGIILSIFAVLGGVFGGWLDDRFGSQRAILISIGGTIVGLILSLSMTPDTILYVIPYDTARPPVHDLPFFRTCPEIIYVLLVIVIAVFITAAYANSRTMLARIAPVPKMAEFFGLYAFSGTATAFLAPFIVGRFTTWFESQRAGMAAILILLCAGFIVMLFVRQERAQPVEEAR